MVAFVDHSVRLSILQARIPVGQAQSLAGQPRGRRFAACQGDRQRMGHRVDVTVFVEQEHIGGMLASTAARVTTGLKGLARRIHRAVHRRGCQSPPPA